MKFFMATRMTEFPASLSVDEARKLTSQKRQWLRWHGVDVPLFHAHKKGYKQSRDHILKRMRYGEDHHMRKGDNVSPGGGRQRARRMYKNIGPCVKCGSEKSERHHVNGNTFDNSPENIQLLCRKCHINTDGRAELLRELARLRRC